MKDDCIYDVLVVVYGRDRGPDTKALIDRTGIGGDWDRVLASVCIGGTKDALLYDHPWIGTFDDSYVHSSRHWAMDMDLPFMVNCKKNDLTFTVVGTDPWSTVSMAVYLKEFFHDAEVGLISYPLPEGVEDYLAHERVNVSVRPVPEGRS